MNLSPLRNHKRRHNFADTPECNQDIEDTSHFIFKCPRYTTPRLNLNHLGNQLELYLYGHRSLSHIDNRNILLLTIKYIKDTQLILV